jgi:hypothetical protein
MWRNRVRPEDQSEAHDELVNAYDGPGTLFVANFD